MKSFPLSDIISGSVKAVVSTADGIYKAGWMLYFIIGLVIFFVVVVYFN